MEKLLIVLCIILVILTIVCCVGIFYQEIISSSVEEGVIVRKEFIPEHTTMIPITTCITVGNVKVPHTIYVNRHYSDQWAITFEGKNKSGKVCQRTVYVSEEVYNNYKINDMFIYDKAICSDEGHYVDEG
jgi:hypothetical protein